MAAKTDAWGDVLSKVGKEVGDAVQNAVSGKKSNGSYKAINHIGNNYMGVAEAATKMFGKEKMEFSKALDSTFRHQTGELAGQLNYGKIAGSYIGAAAAGRVITGGGVYKDGNGNSNLIGVPFV